MNAEAIVEALEIVAARQLSAAGEQDWDFVTLAETVRAELLAELSHIAPEGPAQAAAIADRLRDVANAGTAVADAMQRHLGILQGSLREARQYRGRWQTYAKAAC